MRRIMALSLAALLLSGCGALFNRTKPYTHYLAKGMPVDTVGPYLVTTSITEVETGGYPDSNQNCRSSVWVTVESVYRAPRLGQSVADTLPRLVIDSVGVGWNESAETTTEALVPVTSNELRTHEYLRGPSWKSPFLDISDDVDCATITAVARLVDNDAGNVIANVPLGHAIARGRPQWQPPFQYPNPFSPATPSHFEFSVGAEAPVIVLLYNTKGRVVDTLVNEIMPPGTHHFTLPDGLCTGVYFYKLTIGDDPPVFKKAVFIK